MKRSVLFALSLIAGPVSAFAMPSVGDVVGANPKDATAALEKTGCTVRASEAEGAMIEAKCSDSNSQMWEVYIDPASGKVARISGKD
ncbi:PepSY domain-containing protein [Martelella mediterranea]|uniref:YpeB-like protein with putative protease inhibitory function n=1 Tax=Martelella mediterranea TaxID=293089 RepID=A0A4R3NL13_9HYPH|nr:PepSY domain-containing protein [Martelella mediterranea]TCT34719.1 YpeB-like protein with putative protease inhibitory function [Martelella mediterranea]